MRARKGGEGGKEGAASSVRASTERRIGAAGSSATNIIAAEAKAWKRPLQSARAHSYWAAATACPASCRHRTPQPGHHCALTLAEKAGANRPSPALGPLAIWKAGPRPGRKKRQSPLPSCVKGAEAGGKGIRGRVEKAVVRMAGPPPWRSKRRKTSPARMS